MSEQPGTVRAPHRVALNYNHVYYFHVVATEGSIARAAEQLGVTQPTVSEQIRQLERTLGVALFERTPTGLRLTDIGRHVYEQTTVMFRAGERLLEVLGRSQAPAPRVLRVGVTGGVSRTVAADFLMPVLSLEGCLPSIRTGEFPDLLRDLRGYELDLVLCDSQPLEAATRGLATAEIYRPQLVGVVAPDAARVGGNGEIDWSLTPVMQYRATSAYRWDIESYLDEHDAEPDIVAEADDALLMIEAAARGVCAAFVPRSLARDAIAAGRVRVVATLPSGGAAIHALYQDSDVDLARRAVELLIAHAGQAAEG